MDAIEYIKEAKRLCRSQSICESVSGKCPLLDENGCCTSHIYILDAIEEAEKAVQIVEKWAKDHPSETRQSEFLRMFPNAAINEDDGALSIRPCYVDDDIECCIATKSCDDCRREYWLTEVADND